MDFADKTLRNEYMKKAINIGSNAINLVRDYFDYVIFDTIKAGDTDFFSYWTLIDLDRALDAMRGIK